MHVDLNLLSRGIAHHQKGKDREGKGKVMHRFSTITKAIIRFFVLCSVDGVSLLITSLIFPGIAFVSSDNASVLTEAFAAAFLLSIVNLMIRPLVLLLARPLGFIAVFVLGFLVNAAALLLTSSLLPVFQVSGWLSAIVGGLIFAGINIILTGIFEVNDEGSFYQGLIERLARRQTYENVDPGKRGLVMMEIDGLSYHHLKKAIATGRLPTLKRMMQKEGYELTRVDCGIPLPNIGLPGRHNVWRQQRYSCFPLV